MAQGFARALAGDRVAAWSAGSRPADRIHPRAVELMAERGIDLSSQSPKGLSELPEVEAWDTVVTLGCGDDCPAIPSRQRIDWDLPNPRDMADPEFRAVRDEIDRRVRQLLARIA